jgi:hypothetical protein
MTAQVIAGLPRRPYAPDQWTVVFADFGHDLLVLGTLPTPNSCTEQAEKLFDLLFARNLASYDMTAPSSEAAERRAREYFTAERAGVEPWADTAVAAVPGTVIPAQAGTDEAKTAEERVVQALSERRITAHRDDDVGNTWLIIGKDQTSNGFPLMIGSSYLVLYVYNPHHDEVTVNRVPARPGDEWRLLAGDGTVGGERELMTRPIPQLADIVDAISAWLAPAHD